MISKSQAKYIQSLGQKKIRDEAGEFVAEGPKIINELLAQGWMPQQLFATKEWMMANNQNAILVTEDELARLSFLSTANQVLGVFKQPVESVSGFEGKITLLLDGIQDPGNLGTIIRIADWFGITQICCSSDCADVYAPKVIQSTMGSIARVQVKYELLEQLLTDNNNINSYATALSGTSIKELTRINEGFLIIGNESKGVSTTIMNLCRHKITIPKKGGAESLNAAVATGIVLSHLCVL